MVPIWMTPLQSYPSITLHIRKCVFCVEQHTLLSYFSVSFNQTTHKKRKKLSIYAILCRCWLLSNRKKMCWKSLFLLLHAYGFFSLLHMLHKFPLELQHFYRCEDIFYPPHSNIIINNIAFHIVRISHQYSVLCFDHEATVSSWFQLLLPFTICAQCCNCTLFIFAICIILIVYTQKVSGVAITCTKISITNEHISYWFVILNEMPITCRQPFTWDTLNRTLTISKIQRCEDLIMRREENVLADFVWMDTC